MKAGRKPSVTPTPSALKQRAFIERHPEYREKRRQWNREWIANNRDRYNASKWAYRLRTKQEVLAHYGGGVAACRLCGFANVDALCLDHVEDNGAAHRREIGVSGRNSVRSGMTMYERLKVLGLPDCGLQVLCANCNTIKEVDRRRRLRGS